VPVKRQVRLVQSRVAAIGVPIVAGWEIRSPASASPAAELLASALPITLLTGRLPAALHRIVGRIERRTIVRRTRLRGPAAARSSLDRAVRRIERLTIVRHAPLREPAATRAGVGGIVERIERLTIVGRAWLRKPATRGRPLDVASWVGCLLVADRVGPYRGMSRARGTRCPRRRGCGAGSELGLVILCRIGLLAATPTDWAGLRRARGRRSQRRPALAEVAEPLVVLIVVPALTAS
jgi:hypothetical protein